MTGTPMAGVELLEAIGQRTAYLGEKHGVRMVWGIAGVGMFLSINDLASLRSDTRVLDWTQVQQARYPDALFVSTEIALLQSFTRS
jgi:hypothetical protein